MPAKWRFNELRPGRARNPQIEKFFNDQKDRASPIIREGIQNSLDAAEAFAMRRVPANERTPQAAPIACSCK